MRFDIITIFPESLSGYFNASILGRAQEKRKIEIKLHNLRDFAYDKRKKTDDKSFGGGPGMVLKAEPIIKAVDFIFKRKAKNKKTKIVLFSPSGKKFVQKTAKDWAKKYDNIILICGRYEGVDARVKTILKAEEISVGDCILTGGELPSAFVVDAVSRQIDGVLGKEDSLEEKRKMSGFPLYTKPEIFEHNGKKYKTPKILLSGHHKKIEEWRKKNSAI